LQKDSVPSVTLELKGMPEFSEIPFRESRNFYVMASLKAPFYEETNRAPIDLVTVIDRSGSMSGEKISLVHETLKFVVKQLKATDRLGFVAYDNEVNVPLPLTEMTSQGKEKALAAINGITARGSTNLCGGLLKGLELIEQRTRSNEVTAILLCTDGLTNCGLQTTEDIIHAMCDTKWGRGAQEKAANDPPLQYQQKSQQQQQLKKFGTTPQQSFTLMSPSAKSFQVSPELTYRGPTIHTFGFGSDHSVDLLKAIADKANGVYFFVENPDKIPDAFADCLGGLLSVVAQNINFTFEAEGNVTITKVLTKFKTVEEMPQKRFTVTLGDIQSEEEKDILAEIKLPALPAVNNNVPIVKLSLTYFNVLTSKQEDKMATITVNRPEKVSSTQMVTAKEIDKQRNRLIAADAMTEAKKLGDANKYAEAREILDKAINQIKASVSANETFVQELIQSLNLAKDGLKDSRQYAAYGTYALATMSTAHYQQRATTTAPSYQTTNRRRLQMSYYSSPPDKNQS
jgi:hypothetical protein